MKQLLLVGLVFSLAACAAPKSSLTLASANPSHSASASLVQTQGATVKNDALPYASVAGDFLLASALVAELAFLYPEETRAVVRNLMRSEFARREAERLQIDLPLAEIDSALTRAVENIVAEMGEHGDFTDWSVNRYQRGRADVRAAIRSRLADNMRYQLCLRAAASEVELVKVLALVARSSKTAESLARKLALGADPSQLDPPARIELIPVFAGSGFTDHFDGQPFRLDGDLLWHILIEQERVPALKSLPPNSVLLEQIRSRPIGALEARAWWDEMHRRYTAHEASPLIQSLPRTFVAN